MDKKDNPRQENEEVLRNVELAILKTVNINTNIPYDGLDGTIPSWLPSEHKQKFNDAREKFLQFMVSYCNFDPDQLIKNDIEESQVAEAASKYLNVMKKAIEMMDKFDHYGPTPHITKGILQDITYLCLIRKADKQEKENGKGLEILVGKNVAKDAYRGIKVREGSKLGHIITHGSEDEKNTRHKQYLDDCQSVAKDNPRLGPHTIRIIVAEKHSVSVRTIYTYTKSLRNLLKKPK